MSVREPSYYDLAYTKTHNTCTIVCIRHFSYSRALPDINGSVKTIPCQQSISSAGFDLTLFHCFDG